MKRILIMLYILIIPLIFIIVGSEKAYANDTKDTVWYDAGKFREGSYIRVLRTWEEQYDVVSLNNELVFKVEDYKNLNNHITFEMQSNYSNGEVARLSKTDALSIEINVPTTGLYEIGIDYYITESFSTKPIISIKVNDEQPFNEMTDLTLDVEWKLTPREQENRYNRYGNELLPYSNSELKWYKTYLQDALHRFDTPFKFLLNAGKNTITIIAENMELLIGNIYIYNAKPLITYEEYYNPSLPSFSHGEMIKIQGEHFTYKNDLEIKASYYKDPAMEPYTFRHTVLNRLDGSSMSRGGSKVTYEFKVERTGYYYISFKMLKNSYRGLTSGRRIYIDGEVPFQELNNYLFKYDRKWVNHTLGEDTPYMVYLTEGMHTLSLETSLSHLSEHIDRLYTIMDEINGLGLAVKTITGGSTNAFIDWDIIRYLPTVKEDLIDYSKRVRDIYDEINKLDPTFKSVPDLSTLLVASDQLERLAKRPNKLSSKLTELNEGSGSSYQLIGNAIATMQNQPIDIDMIYIHNVNNLPKPRVNFFVKFIDGIKSFFYSFFDERYKFESNPDDDVLEVWMGRSRLYLDIIQSMIDDEFTKETGIEVKVNILPNTQKIILSNATGSNPDVVLGIESWEPYNYALRGMLINLKEFPDFAEVVQYYHPNIFTPMIFEDGVYGIPETQSFYFLFYRKDILDFLGLTPPNTWEDVLKMLPILQSYQMNFYHPLGGEGAYKGYGLTSQIIYQFGGEIYTENGLGSSLSDEKTANAIKFMTDLFTIHNLPLQVPSFFEHFRSGTLPIGIHTSDLYLTLKYAAPELSGQWEMVPIPGNDYDNDGVVDRWAPTYGQASIIFKNTKLKEEAWELVKWWNKTDTQVKYHEYIKMYLGERYMSIPANLEALERSAWDESVKRVGLQQAEWSRIPAIIPGSYIVEREITNIFNKVVLDQVNYRIAIDESIPRIDRELRRKFTEFRYLENGVIVKEYIVPNNSNIENWIPRKGRDES